MDMAKTNKEGTTENIEVQNVENNEIVNEEIVEQEKKQEKLVKVKALVCLKYNSKYIKIGEKFKVNENDLKEMLKRKLVEKSK